MLKALTGAFDVYESLDSTSDEARRRLESGDLGPGLICAARQTGGRGRRGRRWESPPGGLYCTYYASTTEPPARLAQLGFIAGLAVADLLEAFGVPDPRLKWPNDVLVDSAKIAGVLLESGAAGPGQLWFALGIGVNLGAAPQDLDQPAAGLAGHVSPAQATPVLLERLLHWSGVFERDGFSSIRAAWLARAYGLGRPISAQSGPNRLQGVFADLDADGALVLDTMAGRVRITAGDVFFPDMNG